MEEKILTISIAAYNASKYIDDCVSSLIYIKNFDKLDIIIVDDGSKDDTYLISKKYEEKYPYSVKVIKKENAGWGSTINESIKYAKGKYFKILDSDDKFETNNLDEYIDFLMKNEYDIIKTPYYFYNKKYNNKYLSKNDELQMHSITFKTDILRNNNIHITENCFYTDIEYVLKCMKYSDTEVYFDKPIYIYTIGNAEQSVSYKNFIKNINQHFTTLKVLLDDVYEENMKNEKIFFDRIIVMIKKHFSILYMFPICNDTKNKILEFDNWLKKYNKFYENINLKRVLFLRKNNDLYYVCALILKIRHKIYNLIKYKVG